ncbi:MAG: CheY-like chemotaxis protein [Celeribacter sp.]|jgi:CheY-like chemotaxis protein
MQGDTDILIAGANTTLAIAIELVLTHHGHRPARVLSGPQALSHCKAMQPELIVLETDLPDMSGLEVCQRLRLDPDTAHLPIVMITHNTHAVYARKLRALGADAVLCPPMTAQDIIDIKAQFETGGFDAG